MKTFSNIIGVLCVVIGVIATDLSNDEAERREFMKSLLKNLCDNHLLQAHFDDDYYNKLFDALKSQGMAIWIKNEPTFEERLEYIYNAADREHQMEPHCLHTCINNETYIDCLKTNIFITMLFHSLHCNSHMHDDAHHAKIDFDPQINLMESGRPEAGKMYENRLIENLQRFLKFKYNFNQMRNPHDGSVASIDTSSKMISFDRKSFEEDFKPSNSNGINKSTLVNDGTVPQLTKDLSKVDILKNERGIRVQRDTKDIHPQPISSQINGSLDVKSNGIIENNANLSDHLDENSIPSGIFTSENFKKLDDPSTITLITSANLKKNPIPSEQIISNIPPSVNISMGANSQNHEYPASAVSSELNTIEKKERDVSSLENEHMHVSNAQGLESNGLNSMFLKNETEISNTGTGEKEEELLNDLETIAENFTANSSTLLFEKIKVEENENNLTELVFENVTIPSHDKEESKVVIEGPNDGDKTGSNNHENSIILNKDVKVDNKEPKVENGTEEETFESAMDVSKSSSSRLVFGISALLIVLGLAAGAIAISCFVLKKESPCPRRQRSSVNINQPSQSRG